MVGSDSQASPTITTQTMAVMNALRTDAFLVVINYQVTIVVKHSEWFAANDAVPARRRRDWKLVKAKVLFGKAADKEQGW